MVHTDVLRLGSCKRQLDGSLLLFSTYSLETGPFSLFMVPMFSAKLKISKPHTSSCLYLSQIWGYICVWAPGFFLGCWDLNSCCLVHAATVLIC